MPGRPSRDRQTHLLVAAGHAAVAAGMRVRYFAAADLVETLYRGVADNSVARHIDTLVRFDPVIIDELGFAPLDLVGTHCCSPSSPQPTNLESSASPATGPSTPGTGSCPNTPPQPASSTGSSTTPSSSSPKATATACHKPEPETTPQANLTPQPPAAEPPLATSGDLQLALAIQRILGLHGRAIGARCATLGD